MKDSSVIFLKDWKLLVSSLSTENQIYFWELFTSYEYGVEQKCDNEFVKPIWNFIKSQLDNMKEKYNEKVVERNRTNGSKGGRPKKPIETEETPNNPVGFSETQKNPNEYDNENEDVNEDEVSNDTLLIDDNLPNSFNPIYFTISKAYHNLFLKTKGENKTLLNVTTQSYVDTIRKLIKLDGLTIEQLVAIKLFLEDGANKVRGVDTFWAETIYSVNALRKKNDDGVFYYDMIAQKAKKWIEMDGNKARVKKAVEYVNSKQCKNQEEHT